MKEPHCPASFPVELGCIIVKLACVLALLIFFVFSVLCMEGEGERNIDALLLEHLAREYSAFSRPAWQKGYFNSNSLRRMLNSNILKWDVCGSCRFLFLSFGRGDL